MPAMLRGGVELLGDIRQTSYPKANTDYESAD